MAIDPTFAINSYNKPKNLSPMETTVANILTLLFGVPGFYPSIPSLGMNIKQYLYQFEEDLDADEIEQKLGEQCEDFIDEINSNEIEVQVANYKGNPYLLFTLPVITDNKTYSIVLGVTTNEHGEIIYNFVENSIQII